MKPRAAVRDPLIAELESARQLLLSVLPPEELWARQPVPSYSPIGWHLGHIAAVVLDAGGRDAVRELRDRLHRKQRVVAERVPDGERPPREAVGELRPVDLEKPGHDALLSRLCTW